VLTALALTLSLSPAVALTPPLADDPTPPKLVLQITVDGLREDLVWRYTNC